MHTGYKKYASDMCVEIRPDSTKKPVPFKAYEFHSPWYPTSIPGLRGLSILTADPSEPIEAAPFNKGSSSRFEEVVKCLHFHIRHPCIIIIFY